MNYATSDSTTIITCEGHRIPAGKKIIFSMYTNHDDAATIAPL